MTLRACLGSEKAEENKESIAQLFSIPLPHLLNSLYPCFLTCPWALLLQPASNCFYHCHKPAIKSQLLSRWMWKMSILQTLATRVVPFLTYIYGNIYAYIFNSIYLITELWPLVCIDSALTGLFAVINGSMLCSDLIPSWELAVSLMLIIILVIVCKEALSEAF